MPPPVRRAPVLSVSLTTGVYKITNTVTGKVYVGSASVHFKMRYRHHFTHLTKSDHENPYLQASWNKYGRTAFKFTIIETCNPQECVAREQFWIDTLNACDRRYGYNICPVAGSRLGTKWSDETRRKTTEAFARPEYKEKMSAARSGRKLTEEQIAVRTAKQKGLKRSEETKAKLRATLATAETKARKSAAALAVWAARTPAQRKEFSKKLITANLGKKASEQAKANMSAAQRRRFEKPEERLMASARMMGNSNRKGG